MQGPILQRRLGQSRATLYSSRAPPSTATLRMPIESRCEYQQATPPAEARTPCPPPLLAREYGCAAQLPHALGHTGACAHACPISRAVITYRPGLPPTPLGPTARLTSVGRAIKSRLRSRSQWRQFVELMRQRGAHMGGSAGCYWATRVVCGFVHWRVGPSMSVWAARTRHGPFRFPTSDPLLGLLGLLFVRRFALLL